MTRRVKMDQGDRLFRLLRFPIYKTNNRRRAERSRFKYRYDRDAVLLGRRKYILSLLGILNGLIGLEIELDRYRDDNGVVWTSPNKKFGMNC